VERNSILSPVGLKDTVQYNVMVSLNETKLKISANNVERNSILNLRNLKEINSVAENVRITHNGKEMQ